MLRGRLLAFVIAWPLAGCVTTDVYGPSRRDEPCLADRIDDVAVLASLDAGQAVDLGALTFLPLEAGASYRIETTAPIVEIAGHRSRVLPLDLGRYALDHIYFGGAVSGRTSPPSLKCGGLSMYEHFGPYGQGQRIVYPRLLWLGANKQPIGETPAEPRSLLNSQAGGWALRFQRPAGARYAVVFSDRSRLGQTLLVDYASLPDVLVVPGLPVPITLGQRGDMRRIGYVATSTGTVRHLQVRRVERETGPDGRDVETVRTISPDDLPPRELQPATVQWGRLR